MIRLIGAASSFALLAPSPSFAADNLLMGTVLELCVGNKAVPKDVLAQADASGWESDAGGVLSMLNMEPTYRSRTIGSTRFKLLTKGSIEQFEVGRVQISTCTITSTDTDRAGTLAALRQKLGQDQYVEAENLHIWSFFDDGRSTRLLETMDADSNNQLLKSGIIKSYVLGENGRDQLLVYSEWEQLGASDVVE